jgi:hypothetical protein
MPFAFIAAKITLVREARGRKKDRIWTKFNEEPAAVGTGLPPKYRCKICKIKVLSGKLERLRRHFKECPSRRPFSFPFAQKKPWVHRLSTSEGEPDEDEARNESMELEAETNPAGSEQNNTKHNDSSQGRNEETTEKKKIDADSIQGFKQGSDGTSTSTGNGTGKHSVSSSGQVRKFAYFGDLNKKRKPIGRPRETAWEDFRREIISGREIWTCIYCEKRVVGSAVNVRKHSEGCEVKKICLRED